jgi:ribosomal protein S12 methylthiotransferase accessory factor
MPQEFDPAVPTQWVEARCLTGGVNRFTPAGYAWLWYPFRNEPFYNFGDTNGCAAGNTREGATLRALLELIERDALGIWWYNRLRRPGVPIMDWHDEEIQSACALFRAHERSLDLLDLTNDLGIPTYAAISANTEGREIYYGSACGVCPVSAAKRAIEELIQFWFWETRFGTGIDRRAWFDAGSVTTHPYLEAAGTADIPTVRPETPEEALNLCINAVRGAGLNAYSIDLTRPELGVPVIRVIVPGLRHYGPRFARGRLFDVPVKLGWRSTPLNEADLNTAVCIL